MSDIDVKYLRDNGIPQLLENIAADIATQKPADPEQFLRDKFALGADDTGVMAGDDVKLHANSLDPSCATVLIAAAYARATVDYAEIDVEANMHMAAAFTAVNPYQKVPVLEHKGLTLYDSGAIARYLCHGKPALPLAARDRAKIDVQFEAIRGTALAEATAAAVECVFAPRRNRRPVDRTAVSAAVERFQAALATVVTTSFKHSVWVVGKDLSIADMALGAAAFTMHSVVGVDCFAADGPAKQWWAAMQAESCFVDGLRGFAAAAAQVRQ
jgi:glutathione S-transferase